jgi:hypothetical protein
MAMALRPRLVDGSVPLLLALAVVVVSNVSHPFVETFRELKAVP